jgi:hypothetical protein
MTKEKNSMRYLRQIILLLLVPFMALPTSASAWNKPGHMLSGAIAFQVLEQENPETINKVKAILQNHPFHSPDEWQKELADLPPSDQDLMLFMLAARWADDARGTPFHEGKSTFHFINLPFKPAGQPAEVQIKDPQPVNILTALAENESGVKNENDGEQKAIALAWLFHLVGDIHQPLHTTQLFTVDFPKGDRGGNEICIRKREEYKPINLHGFWDDIVITSLKLTTIRDRATSLRDQFSRDDLAELAMTDFKSWVNESFALGVAKAYTKKVVGMPKPDNGDCSDLQSAPVLPSGYIPTAEPAADRRMIISGYRLADLLTRITQNFN